MRYFFNYGLELYQYASDTAGGKHVANEVELVKAQEKLQTQCKAESHLSTGLRYWDRFPIIRVSNSRYWVAQGNSIRMN